MDPIKSWHLTKSVPHLFQRARYTAMAPSALQDSHTIVTLTKGMMDEGSWDAICRKAKAGKSIYLLNHGKDVEIINPPPTFDDELSAVFTHLSISTANNELPRVVEARGPVSEWENPLLALGYMDGPIEAELDEWWDNFIGDKPKRYDELEQMEKEDLHPDRDIPRSSVPPSRSSSAHWICSYSKTESSPGTW